MKLRILLLVLTGILLLSVCGCARYMSREEISEYSIFDYNIIWDKAEYALYASDNDTLKNYYKIEGIPDEDYIAYVETTPDLFEGKCYNPTVLVHKNIDKKYSLDTSTAQFTLRGYGFTETGLEHWQNLGETHRKQILAPIEESVAQEFAKQLPADPSEYVEKKGSDKAISFKNEMEDGTYSYSYLWIEIYLEGYDNLLWCGEVIKAGDDYLIAIHQNKKLGRYKYICCNDALAESIDQIVDEYGLN